MSGKSTGITAAGRWSLLSARSHIEETLTPVNASVHMPTSWKEIKKLHPGGPLPPPYLLKTNAALSAALGGCRRARWSGTFYLVPAYTSSETRALFLVPFKCVRAASPEKTSLSLFIWLFPLITLSPSAGGGLSKQQKHQNFYVLFSCRGENGVGGGGGVWVQLKIMRVEGCSGGGCCAARGEARTACPPTPLWGIAARFALSQHPPARAMQPALGRLTAVMAISFAK